MDKPPKCPPDVYEIISRCWEAVSDMIFVYTVFSLELLMLVSRLQYVKTILEYDHYLTRLNQATNHIQQCI